jgi:hypothetical protein
MDLGSSATLEPGAMLSGCRIEPNTVAQPDSGVEPYVVEFLSAGRRYVCPLFCFQPRTQTVARMRVDETKSLDAVAV